MKKFFTDFKNFIARGNVLDMAVAVVVGSAFTAIVNSLVNDIIMPLIAWAIGGAAFSDLCVVLKPEVLDEAGNVIETAVTWNYGNFIQLIINFLIIAFCMFLVIKLFMAAKEKKEKLDAKLSEDKNAEENKTKEAKAEEAAAETPVEVKPDVNEETLKVLSEIRDMLKEQSKKYAALSSHLCHHGRKRRKQNHKEYYARNQHQRAVPGLKSYPEEIHVDGIFVCDCRYCLLRQNV